MFSLWRGVMSLRGASEDQVATGERQVHSLMHRRSSSELALFSARLDFRE